MNLEKVKAYPWILHVLSLHLAAKEDICSDLEARFKRNKERIIQHGEAQKCVRISQRLRPRSDGKSRGSYLPHIADLLSSFKESDRVLKGIKESNQKFRCEIEGMRDYLFNYNF